MLIIWVICLMGAIPYHIYLIYQNGIKKMFIIWNICLLDAIHYHIYLIYQNGMKMLYMLKKKTCLIDASHYHNYLFFYQKTDFSYYEFKYANTINLLNLQSKKKE